MTTRYTKSHEYVRVEGGTGVVGITDYAQSQLGDVVFVELPPIGQSLSKGAEAAIQAITRFTRPINYLGLPALEVPAGQSRSGMPIGLQLIGRPFDHETVIALGRAFQTATKHHRRIPVLP